MSELCRNCEEPKIDLMTDCPRCGLAYEPTEAIAPNIMIVFMNGLVMAFDRHGQQMPVYQGYGIDLLPRLKDLNLNNTELQREIGSSLFTVKRDEFFKVLEETTALKQRHQAIVDMANQRQAAIEENRPTA